MSYSKQKGAGLVEPLIAIAILSVGILGIARFQLASMMQTTDAQSRMTAATLADELASLVRIDAAHAACYTVPQQGACASQAAKDQATDWGTRVKAAVPGHKSAQAAIDGNEFVITVTWASKAFKEERQLEVRTDVRP